MGTYSEEYTRPVIVQANCPADEIMDLAAGCSGAGKEAGFKIGFQAATKLWMEGMKGTGS